MKKIAIKTKVWEYVDSAESKPESEELEFSLIFDFIVAEIGPIEIAEGIALVRTNLSIMRSARKITEFSNEQRKL